MREELTMLKERLELRRRLSIYYYYELRELNAKKSFGNVKIERRSSLKAPSDLWLNCSIDLE